MPQRKTNKRVQKKIAPPTRTNGWVTYKGTRHTLYRKADGKLVVKVFNKRSNKYSYVAAPSKKGGADDIHVVKPLEGFSGINPAYLKYLDPNKFVVDNKAVSPSSSVPSSARSSPCVGTNCEQTYAMALRNQVIERDNPGY